MGALDASYRDPLSTALKMRELRLIDVAPGGELASVGPQANVADVQAVTRDTRRRRVLVRDGERTLGVVHVRDTLPAGPDEPVASYLREPLLLDADTTLPQALRAMKESRTHLIVVTADDTEVGVATMTDILPKLLPNHA